MSRAAIFVMDEDHTALQTLLTDLRRRFGSGFAVAGEQTREAAIAALEDMATAATPVALLLVDAACGDVLDRAHELHPGAKRVLLVDRDYSTTSPAVQAMTSSCTGP